MTWNVASLLKTIPSPKSSFFSISNMFTLRNSLSFSMPACTSINWCTKLLIWAMRGSLSDLTFGCCVQRIAEIYQVFPPNSPLPLYRQPVYNLIGFLSGGSAPQIIAKNCVQMSQRAYFMAQNIYFCSVGVVLTILYILEMGIFKNLEDLVAFRQISSV